MEKIQSLFNQKIVLNKHTERESSFSTYDQSLNEMNVFHLSCQFYPEAMQIFHRTISDQQAQLSSSGLDTIMEQFKLSVNEKNDSSEKTPLHIAAKKSLTHPAR